jgi:hypothetical protein
MKKCTREVEFMKFEGTLTDEMKEWFKERDVSVELDQAELDECTMSLSINKAGDTWPFFTYLSIGEYVVYDNAISSDVDDDDITSDCCRTESFWKTYTEENFKKSFNIPEEDLDKRYPAGFCVSRNNVNCGDDSMEFEGLIKYALSRADDLINHDSDTISEFDGGDKYVLKYVRTSLDSGDITIYALVPIKTLDVSKICDDHLDIKMIDV